MELPCSIYDKYAKSLVIMVLVPNYSSRDSKWLPPKIKFLRAGEARLKGPKIKSRLDLMRN